MLCWIVCKQIRLISNSSQVENKFQNELLDPSLLLYTKSSYLYSISCLVSSSSYFDLTPEAKKALQNIFLIGFCNSFSVLLFVVFLFDIFDDCWWRLFENKAKWYICGDFNQACISSIDLHYKLCIFIIFNYRRKKK